MTKVSRRSDNTFERFRARLIFAFSVSLLKGNPIKDWIQSALFYRGDDLLGSYNVAARK